MFNTSSISYDVTKGGCLICMGTQSNKCIFLNKETSSKAWICSLLFSATLGVCSSFAFLNVLWTAAEWVSWRQHVSINRPWEYLELLHFWELTKYFMMQMIASKSCLMNSISSTDGWSCLYIFCYCIGVRCSFFLLTFIWFCLTYSKTLNYIFETN